MSLIGDFLFLNNESCCKVAALVRIILLVYCSSLTVLINYCCKFQTIFLLNAHVTVLTYTHNDVGSSRSLASSACFYTEIFVIIPKLYSIIRKLSDICQQL